VSVLPDTGVQEARPSPPLPPELNARELARWAWRQLTSMRTALVLLFLLAVAAIPGSVIPQSQVDALKTSNWKADHPTLTPIYEKLQLFSVYDSVWFSAIYILLMISLVGCIVPRTAVYWKALRARPPAAPRNLTRLPDSITFTSELAPEALLERAGAVLKQRRYRVSTALDQPGSTALDQQGSGDWVAAERGYLREAGNLLFHLSVLIVLAGFAIGSLFGYKGGVIVLVGGGFSNNLTQYDDFAPGSLFRQSSMEPFSFDILDFDVDWLTSGPRQGMARGFVSHLSYQETPASPVKTYDLKVNHPLTIGGTEIFLIGHGYAPVITIKDGTGKVAFSGPVVFLPRDQSFLSFGVAKAPDAKPRQIGLEGLFFPTYANVNGNPMTIMGDDLNPTISMQAYVGDLGLDNGVPQSVYELRKNDLQLLKNKDGSMFRVDLQRGQTIKLPDGAGSVTFDKVVRWNKIQISRTPAKGLALFGMVLALLGLIGSLYIRPRRVWVRARRTEDGTLVEVAGLDRSGGDDTGAELESIKQALEPGLGERS
jgi:cytochrome c biogenesis protein